MARKAEGRVGNDLEIDKELDKKLTKIVCEKMVVVILDNSMSKTCHPGPFSHSKLTVKVGKKSEKLVLKIF